MPFIDTVPDKKHVPVLSVSYSCLCIALDLEENLHALRKWCLQSLYLQENIPTVSQNLLLAVSFCGKYTKMVKM